MTTEHELSTRDESAMVDSLVTRGDWSGLNPAERARVYTAVCKQHGLNPMSQPFAFLRLNGKEVLYANRGATDQLAAMHHVNRKIIDGPKIVDICGTKVALCTAEATLPNGRVETATATLPVVDPVNLYMKLETKAKRRATLSILGLGMMDEMETETIPGAERLAMGAVTLVRDDAPAQLAAPDDEFPAIDATSLDGLASWYAGLQLRAEDTERADAAVGLACDYAIERGYRLASPELHSVLAGRLHPTLRAIHDALAKQHTPAGVVAAYQEHAGAVDQIEREDGRKACVTVGARYFGERHSPALSAQARGPAFRAALSPQPPTKPTGTDAPTASAPASADGGSVAPSQSAGAQASANDGPRYVADTDAAHVQVAGTWRETEAGWAAHLAEMTARRRVEASVGCNGALLGPRFLTLAAERIVEIDATRPLPAGVARLTVIGVTQTLERVALDADRYRRRALLARRASVLASAAAIGARS
jgi:hypothetical protein